MTAFAAVNDVRIVSGSITIPYFGAWMADLVLATPDPLSSAPAGCTVVIGGLTLIGTAYRAAPFAGSRAARLVAGAGGWQKTVASRSYFASGGVQLSMVLGDAAKDCGEKLVLGADTPIGSYYTRANAPAARVLRDLVSEWWVDPTGVTQVASTRSSSAIVSPFTIIAWDGARGWFQVATESVQDWMPGNTFSSPTVPAMQTISLSVIKVEGNGTLRVEVLSTGAVDA